jgi:hypothetical protein
VRGAVAKVELKGLAEAAPTLASPSQFPATFLHALVRPLYPASLLSGIGAALLVTVGVLAVLVSPRLGLIAGAVLVLQVLALRLRVVRDASAGREDVVWPDWDEGLGAAPIYLGLSFVFLPAIVLGLAAWGDDAFDPLHAGSIPNRMSVLWEPHGHERALADAARDATQSARELQRQKVQALEEARAEVGVERDEARADPVQVERDRRADDALVMLDAIVGDPPAPPLPPPPLPAPEEDELQDEEAEPPAQLPAPPSANSITRSVEAKLRVLATPAATPLGLAAQGALVLGLFLFPMALLAAAKLDSLYAPIHLPLLVLSVLRAPVAYLAVALLFMGQLVVVVGVALLAGPTILTSLPPVVGHALALLSVCAAATLSGIATSSALGGFYRCYAGALCWE